MFHGSITALITPFHNKNHHDHCGAGDIDWAAFDRFVEWQIDQGTHGVVPCGTTGESPTLSHKEHNDLVKRCVAVVNKRIPVIAGTGSNSTLEAIDFTRHAKECGADAALVVTPYYNKPTQEGLYQHFKTIHDAAAIPIIIYNIPGRCIVDMSVTTMARLSELPNIIGVKDATNDLARPLNTRAALGNDFCQLSGEDATVAAFLAQGGHGCISVTSNIAPALCAQMHNAWRDGDMAAFNTARDRLIPVHDALFVESSPAPVKYAAHKLGHCENTVRLPLVPASDNARNSVDRALISAGLL